MAVQADAEDFFSKSAAPAVRTGDPTPVIVDLAQPEAGLATALARVPTEIRGFEIQTGCFWRTSENLPQIVSQPKERRHRAAPLSGRRPRFERQNGQDLGSALDAVP